VLILLHVCACSIGRRHFSDGDSSRPPTGYHRLAPIEDTLTSHVRFAQCVHVSAVGIIVFKAACSICEVGLVIKEQ